MKAPRKNDYADPIQFIEALAAHLLTAPRLEEDALEDIKKETPAEIISIFNTVIDKMLNAATDLIAAAADIRKMTAPPTVENGHDHKVGQYVKRIGKIIRIERIVPKPQPFTLDFIFEERKADIEMRRNGKVIQECGSYTDFYGEGTGEEEAIKKATEIAESEAIMPDSEVELVVVRTVSQSRYNFNLHKAAQPNIYMMPFFDQKDIGCHIDVAEDVETDVWSTKLGTINP
jgi:hypothetical protein